MDTRLLTQLPTEQARCREMARHYNNMGSVGCFAAALIEQALQRADRAIIEGGEDDIRAVLLELQAFNRKPEAPHRSRAAEYAFPGIPHAALSMAPVGRRAGRGAGQMAAVM